MSLVFCITIRGFYDCTRCSLLNYVKSASGFCKPSVNTFVKNR